MMRIPSVMDTSDGVIVDALVSLHAPADPVVVDVTCNTGKMWRDAASVPRIRLDIDPSALSDMVADFTHLPLRTASVDVLVFDPPHMLDSASVKYKMYGITERMKGTISGYYPPFLAEAARVLLPGGIILAKLADQVHDHRYRWEMVDFVVAAREAGLTPCDLVVKTGTGAATLVDPKWKSVIHTRRAHSYWITVRNGRCER